MWCPFGRTIWSATVGLSSSSSLRRLLISRATESSVNMGAGGGFSMKRRSCRRAKHHHHHRAKRRRRRNKKRINDGWDFLAGKTRRIATSPSSCVKYAARSLRQLSLPLRRVSSSARFHIDQVSWPLSTSTLSLYIYDDGLSLSLSLFMKRTACPLGARVSVSGQWPSVSFFSSHSL